MNKEELKAKNRTDAKRSYWKNPKKVKKMRQKNERLSINGENMPRKPKYVIQVHDIENGFLDEDKTFMEAYRGTHFHVEHQKYFRFLNRKIIRADCRKANRIIYLYVGAPLECNDLGIWFKNDALALYELGFGSKTFLMGLKGNGLNKVFDKSKEIKKRQWLGLQFTKGGENFEIDESKIIETFITEKSLNLIPFDERATIYFVMKDGKAETTSKEYFALLKARSPKSIIYFLWIHRNKGNPPFKCDLVAHWGSPSPAISLYRLKSSTL